ncbi:ComEA family DNA-binding protein [Nocardioides sp. CN2-186]|uniref:ComEA family DNA-binding protein n=1 Tax=Nocardioides tweenelious TaxID=3156607 RepID=UPI0032B457EA
MPTRRPSPEHQEAVSRRLALLSAELAAARPVEQSPPDDAWEEPAPLVPVPGRHASHRAVASLGRLDRGRFALGPAQLTVVAVLVAVGLAVTGWWLVRGDPDRLEAPTIPPPSEAAALADASPVAADSSTSPAAGSVTVDVTGKVRKPGIVVLDPGARVVDALEAAGGARAGVDLSGLNLARVLVDGEQVVVGVTAVPPAPSTASGSAPTPGAALVNLNTATQTELEALPEVGPVTAQAILSWRSEHGGFTAVDELLEVDGIGDATLGQLAPYVTV